MSGKAKLLARVISVVSLATGLLSAEARAADTILTTNDRVEAVKAHLKTILESYEAPEGMEPTSSQKIAALVAYVSDQDGSGGFKTFLKDRLQVAEPISLSGQFWKSLDPVLRELAGFGPVGGSPTAPAPAAPGADAPAPAAPAPAVPAPGAAASAPAAGGAVHLKTKEQLDLVKSHLKSILESDMPPEGTTRTPSEKLKAMVDYVNEAEGFRTFLKETLRIETTLPLPDPDRAALDPILRELAGVSPGGDGGGDEPPAGAGQDVITDSLLPAIRQHLRQVDNKLRKQVNTDTGRRMTRDERRDEIREYVRSTEPNKFLAFLRTQGVNAASLGANDLAKIDPIIDAVTARRASLGAISASDVQGFLGTAGDVAGFFGVPGAAPAFAIAGEVITVVESPGFASFFSNFRPFRIFGGRRRYITTDRYYDSGTREIYYIRR